MNPRAVLEIALREVRVRGRSKGFLVSTLLMALALAALAVVPALLGGDDEADPGPPEPITVAMLGEPDATLSATFKLVAEATGRPIALTPVSSRAEAEAAVVADAARFGVDATGATPEVLVGPGSFFGDRDPVATIVADAGARLQSLVAAGLDLEEAIAALVVAPLPIATVGDDEDDRAARGGLAYVGLMFVYTTLILYGSWTVNGIIEEKANRVVEVLLATVRPRELLAGKVLGLGALGISQVAVVLATVLGSSAAVGASVIPSSAVPALLGILGWWVLGFLFFAVVMAAFGSLVSRAEEAQAAIGPAMVLVVASVLAGFVSLEEPDGAVAVVTSFVPFTAPLVMTVRTTLGAASGWEMVAAAGSIVAGTVVMTLLGARIYAGAVMRTHGKVKLREAWRGQQG